MNATNNINERHPSQTLTRLRPIEHLEWEGAETTNKLMALPFFIITFSMTALITLSVYHARFSEQQHNTVIALTIFSCAAMFLGLSHFTKTQCKTLLIYSVLCALVLGVLAPLGW